MDPSPPGIKELLKTRMEQMHTYHSSKENLAHAALVALVVFASALVSADTWPPKWVPSIPESWVALIVATAIWGVVYLFLRLRLRWKQLVSAFAGAAVAALLVFAYILLSRATWPPDWVPSVPARWVALIGITVIWCVVHSFIRFQLRMKRLAAAYVGGILVFLKRWSYSGLEPSDEWLKPYGLNSSNDTVMNSDPLPNSKALDFLDRHFFPIKGIFPPPDEELKMYPEGMVREVLITLNKSGSIKPERSLSVMSIVVFVVMFAHGLLATRQSP